MRCGDGCTVVLLHIIYCGTRACCEDRTLRFAWFAQDDCRFRPKVRLTDVLDAAKEADGRVARLGYGRRQGLPKVGARLVSFSRAALAAFRRDAREILEAGPFAFDTLVRLL